MDPQVIADHARIARGRKLAIDATLLRTRSVAGREILAHLATGGEATLDEVLAQVLERGDAAVANWDPAWLGRLARVLALSRNLDSDLEQGIACFDAIFAAFGPGGFDEATTTTYLDSLYTTGRFESVLRAIEDLPTTVGQRERLWTDLHNPFVSPMLGDGPEARGRWLVLLANAMGLRTGPIEPILVRDDMTDVDPFDRLTSTPLRTVTGPLVTVIVTSYNPSTPLITALDSLRHQTWEDLEILVIDDASPSDPSDLLKEAKLRDPRIRTVGLDRNQGTYHARNVGLALATGEFVTFHDSDDWSHPRRIESQATLLHADPQTIAARGSCVRVSPKLELTFLGYEHLRPNASSLMFRREPVLARIGFMDTSRKAADSEYHRRIEAAFPNPTIDIRETAYSLVRLGGGSLSRSDFSPGWQHPARRAYTGSYQRFHKRIRSGADPFLAIRGERSFPIPNRFTTNPRPRADLDVVFAGDWRELGGPQLSMLAEIAATRGSGLTVGVAHLEAFRFMSDRNPPLCDPLLRLIEAGEIEPLLLDDLAHVDLLVVRYPSVLQFPPHDPASWQVNTVWIVANQTPSEPDGSDARYHPGDCDEESLSLFGTAPLWVPQGPNARRALKDFPGINLADFDDPAIVDLASWFREHVPTPGKIRIGRYSRDNLIKFPSTSRDLLAAYPSAPDFEVTFMGGGRKTIPLLLQGARPPSNWRMLEFKSVPTKRFLQDIDFFVYFDNPDANEAFGRSILEALASGVVVILPEKHRPTFGDAAIYCAPAEVESVVRGFASDIDAYRNQVERAVGVVTREFSPASFVERIAPFVGALGR